MKATTRFRRMLWLALAVLALAAQGASAARQSRLADRTIQHGGPPLVLQLPATGPATYEVLHRLLASAQVLYALEEAPSSREPTPPDLAPRPDRALVLTGLKLGEALDRIVAADPRYQWQESGSRIFVRQTGVRSVLDLRIATLVLERATLPDTLSALMRALDPRHPVSRVIASGETVSGGQGTEKSSRPREPAISMRLKQVTLLDALNAIADSRSDLSWIVRQDGTGDVDGLGIALSTRSASATVMSERERGNVRTR